VADTTTSTITITTTTIMFTEKKHKVKHKEQSEQRLLQVTWAFEVHGDKQECGL
jgi:hypothetical protein